MTREEWRRLLIHTYHGAVISAGGLVNLWLGGSWLFLCVTYQYMEDWRIKDNSYLDMRGYMVGWHVGVVLYWLIKYRPLNAFLCWIATA